jgi:hypothetical protein
MGTLYELRDGRRNPSILADGPLFRQRGRTDRSRAEGFRGSASSVGATEGARA